MVNSNTLLSTPSGRNFVRRLVHESQVASSQQERKSFEMIYTFFSHLIDQDFFQSLFEAMAVQEDDVDESIRYHGEGVHRDGLAVENPSLCSFQGLRIEEITDDVDSNGDINGGKKHHQSYICSEQVILLKIIDSMVYSHHQRQESTPLAHQLEPAVSLETVGYLTRIFANVSKLTIRVLQTLDQSGVGEHAVEDLSNLSAAITLLLGCFSHLCMYDDGLLDEVPASAANSDENSDDQEETERLKSPARVPEWFKAQHMTIVQGELVENSIGMYDVQRPQHH